MQAKQCELFDTCMGFELFVHQSMSQPIYAKMLSALTVDEADILPACMFNMLERHILDMIGFRINYVTPSALIMDLLSLIDAPHLLTQALSNSYLCLICKYWSLCLLGPSKSQIIGLYSYLTLRLFASFSR